LDESCDGAGFVSLELSQFKEHEKGNNDMADARRVKPRIIVKSVW
jgi:hypothetical protein